MSYFDTERKPIDVTAKGKTVTFWVRELGYREYQALSQKHRSIPDAAERGNRILDETVLACVEVEDGKPAFPTLEDWHRIPAEAAEPIMYEAMLMQGIDLKATVSDEVEADEEGNA